jgi:elongation factor G
LWTEASSFEPGFASPNTVFEQRTKEEIRRIKHIRNIGILAHVDAGKTTVTERMLALAGVVRRAGSVDDGDTVTDYLPAERERGITIQSAAISFPWKWHNNRKLTSDGVNDAEQNDSVTISLIDTPGHVDFSVEVNRSVAVLDGAVLVVDSVAGVQAQTETVWRAMTRPSLNNHERTAAAAKADSHGHEPLPCLAVINKMDKDGCHFANAVKSLRRKLPGANPIPIHLPLFRSPSNHGSSLIPNVFALPIVVDDEEEESSSSPSWALGDFVGVVDLIHMRAIVWPENNSMGVSNVENCIPDVIPLLRRDKHEPLDENCQITAEAFAARHELLESLAEIDAQMEEYYLTELEPSHAELRSALRRVTLSRHALPVLAAAALRGKGVEPVLDAIADFLPSPLDRQSPGLTVLDDQKAGALVRVPVSTVSEEKRLTLGHPLHPSLLALAFKVIHMKGRGGSGDGRVVFARVYSGELRERDTVHVVTPPAPGEAAEKPRKERIGGMLVRLVIANDLFLCCFVQKAYSSNALLRSVLNRSCPVTALAICKTGSARVETFAPLWVYEVSRLATQSSLLLEELQTNQTRNSKGTNSFAYREFPLRKLC